MGQDLEPQVRDLKLVGDGELKDAASIRAALDAARLRKAPEISMLRLPGDDIALALPQTRFRQDHLPQSQLPPAPLRQGHITEFSLALNDAAQGTIAQLDDLFSQGAAAAFGNVVAT